MAIKGSKEFLERCKVCGNKLEYRDIVHGYVTAVKDKRKIARCSSCTNLNYVNLESNIDGGIK